MQRLKGKKYFIEYKLAYTAIIILVYILGRNIPLHSVDVSAYKAASGNAEIMLMQAIGGDVNQYSLFALGLAPLMISSLLMLIVMSCWKIRTKVKMSPKKMKDIQLILILIISVFQALIRVQELRFDVIGKLLFTARITAAMEMVTGVMLVMWLTERNKKYGLGGQVVLIYINIIDGIMKTVMRYNTETLLPLCVSIVALFATLIMEGSELRIPMQRISIYNVYADKNYLAIKLNPVGVMPVMFSSAFFTLLKLIMSGLHWLFPESEAILRWQENLVLTNPVGIGTYIAILYFLTIGFAMIIISPGEIAEQLLKSGDSIMNLHAGRETRKYLTEKLCIISFFSATVMSVCLGIPMILQLTGDINGELVMFPVSVMMLTGLWYNLYQEFKTVKSYEAYRPFI
ncbi:preprotein translocase subunit SecY [Parablautia intestinalis]|uniref:preprotein translocase subunit SecY n=1 Tax=Parablautia intestinalis TaxID=2320100 RepID=UPI00256EB88A|nr:preprotein translocase subunit SecY [Parablautia intestinalis]